MLELQDIMDVSMHTSSSYWLDCQGGDKKVQLFCDLTTCGLFFSPFSHFITKTLKCDKRLV